LILIENGGMGMYLYDEKYDNYLEQQCDVLFKEVSSGLYEVKKDRFGTYSRRFVDAIEVADELVRTNAVVIQRIDGSFVSDDIIGSANYTMI
jgi:hypothetical protein